MNKSRKHYTEQKKIQKSLYCMITYICNFRKYKANLQWQKVDQFSRVNGVGVGGRGHKGTFWSEVMKMYVLWWLYRCVHLSNSFHLHWLVQFLLLWRPLTGSLKDRAGARQTWGKCFPGEGIAWTKLLKHEEVWWASLIKLQISWITENIHCYIKTIFFKLDQLQLQIF